MRYGPKKTSPISWQNVIPRKTVITIIDRKNNWLKIQVDGDDDCYIGWVEESKVIKFKIVN